MKGDRLAVELRPFRGIRYNPAHVDDLFAVLAPPYDVISQQAREIYYQRHHHNVVRLIYGRDESGDTGSQNRYTRAAHYLQTWLRCGVLTRDTTPAMYLCMEQYLLPDGRPRERQGLIALCRLEPYERGVVLPHEETSPIPKRMLFDLRSTVEANLSQIFALYADDTGKVQEILATQRQWPDSQSFRDQDGMLHRVWALQDASLLADIQRAMAGRWALIADGHHRYETCLEYQRLMRQSTPHCTGEEWFNFAMLYLTDIHDPGLTILPTHRLLRGLPATLVAQLPERLRDSCQLEALPFHTSAQREERLQGLLQAMRRCGESAHVFGLYTGADTLWLLTLSGSPDVGEVPVAGSSEPWQALDVSLLHDFLLAKVLGVEVQEDGMAFTQDASEAVELVARQAYQVAFLLNPTKVEQIVQHAMAGKRMPRKSTYFYPKLLTGMVIHKEVGDEDHDG
jgi:uncharacterized protein (DUF1015 family)